MPVRNKVRRKSRLATFLQHPAGKILLGLGAAVFLLCLGTFTFYYVRYSKLIDEKLRSGPFQATSMIFAAPRSVSVGEQIDSAEVLDQLRRSGYTESRTNRMGWYHVRDDSIAIFPGPDSYFDQESGVIKFEQGRVAQIISLRDNTDRLQYLLEPELITNLSDRNREKRRLVRFAAIPKVLVDAVISAEDKRFFQHSGFDPLRVIKAAYVDLKQRRIEEGASTLSMQVARMFWLDLSRTWTRKAAEVLITLQLEQRLSKEEIFEFYANQIPLGRRGSFSIHGFGEGAQAFFAKDIRDLTLPEAALLAGVIQGPSYHNPFRNPERAKARRNVILGLMRDNKFITEEEYQAAREAPLGLAPASIESTNAPYFVDLVNDELTNEFQGHDFKSEDFRVYTTLDLNLQRAAAEAIRIGLKETDDVVNRRRKRNPKLPEAQVALVALDPHTGAVKALIGGRNYGTSQLNRVLAKRQPGSIFKPFVYAAAMETAVRGSQHPLTPASTVVDQPTTFYFDNQEYTPSNFNKEFFGEVSLRRALSKSMNVATVKVAEMVGYDAVEQLAIHAGMNLRIKPTPAIALGAYEVTPLEMAGAYTVFTNQGIYVKPNWITLIRDRQGNILHTKQIERREVLDPRVAYLVVNMMEEVLRTGTGAGVRSRGFVLPAAGKTGTSHDGWFAGFTSKLLCIVWVGFDDNRELNIEGSRSALPIWTEFMKRASQFREYRNAEPFAAPDGVISVEIDPATGELATPACPLPRTEVFIAGTQPLQPCRLHGGAATRVASWEMPSTPPPSLESTTPPRGSGVRASIPPPPPGEKKPQPAPPRKRGFFGRLLDVFK